MKIRKVLLAIGMSMIMTVALTACGGSGSSSSSSDEASSSGGSASSGTTTSDSEGFTFTSGSATVVMGAEADPIIESLGDDYDYFESESCAFDGLDKVYTYSGFKLNTYPVDDVDYVLSIVFRDDTVETDEGITIGSTKDEVLEAYGDPDEEKSTSLVYEKGDTTLTIGISGDAVSTITIAYVTD